MTNLTLMVHLEIGRSNAALLQFAGDLAERFHAGIIGIAAGQPMQLIYTDGYTPPDLIQRDLDEIDKEIEAAEAEFRNALQKRVDRLEWRSTVTYGALADYVAHEARSADLVITGVPRDVSVLESERHVNVGDLVMQVGRPVLVVPTTASTFKLDRVLVGWKESRETRRAVLDALPFLEKATHVTVVEIAAKDDTAEARKRLDQIVVWLKHHGVAVQPIVSTSTGDDAKQLAAIAEQQGADLIVAGAYGHSRVRELVLGGVTRDLLLRADRCALVSH